MSKRHYILFLAVLLMSSCATQKMYLTLDLLRPGKISFPKEVENILIVNNSVQQPQTYGHATSSHGPKQASEVLSTDSASVYCLAGAVEDLAGIGFFDNVTLLEESLNSSGSFFKLSYLENADVDTLCAVYDADALIALNRIAVRDQVNDYILESGEYLSTLDVKAISNWSIHYPASGKFETVNLADSLFWESVSYNRTTALSELPSRADAIIDLSIFSGRNTVQRLLPRWEKVDRYFYLNKDELLRQGLDSIRYKDFEGALVPWTQALETAKKNETQAFAAMNIAVAYELLGDLSEAVSHAQKAIQLLNTTFMVNFDYLHSFGVYLDSLIARQREVNILEQQM